MDGTRLESRQLPSIVTAPFVVFLNFSRRELLKSVYRLAKLYLSPFMVIAQFLSTLYDDAILSKCRYPLLTSTHGQAVAQGQTVICCECGSAVVRLCRLSSTACHFLTLSCSMTRPQQCCQSYNESISLPSLRSKFLSYIQNIGCKSWRERSLERSGRVLDCIQMQTKEIGWKCTDRTLMAQDSAVVYAVENLLVQLKGVEFLDKPCE